MEVSRAIDLVDDKMCWGRGTFSVHHMPEYDEYWQAGEMAIDALKELDEYRWIPCSEKLPKNAYGKEFLLTIIPNTDYPDYTKVVIGELGCWNNDVGDAFSCIKPTMINGIIYNIYQPIPLNQVVAWRPAPKPFQLAEVKEKE